MDLSIVIVNWNTRDLVAGCLDSVFAYPASQLFDVWVVDNASTDGSPDLLRSKYPQVHLIVNARNEGFAAASNLGIARSAGRYILLLNSDAQVGPGALAAMIDFMEAHPFAGALGPQLVNPDGSFQASYAPFPSLFSELMLVTTLARFLLGPHAPSPGPRHGETARPVDWVAGAALLVRRSMVQAIGPLDSGYFMYSEDTDWCWRMWRAGWSVWYVPDVQVIHHAGASSRQQPARNYGALYRSKIRFFARHYGTLATETLRAVLIAAAVLRLGLWHAAGRLARSSTARTRLRLRIEQERALLRACQRRPLGSTAGADAAL